MWVHLIFILKKSKIWNNQEQIKVQMNFKNIYIHEGRLFICFVLMVYETKVTMTQGKLLNLPFSQSIGIFFVRNDIFKILKI
jgi:hypothetical protein